MQRNFDEAFDELLRSWQRHEQLRAQHASFMDLLDARTRLMEARVASPGPAGAPRPSSSRLRARTNPGA